MPPLGRCHQGGDIENFGQFHPAGPPLVPADLAAQRLAVGQIDAEAFAAMGRIAAHDQAHAVLRDIAHEGQHALVKLPGHGPVERSAVFAARHGRMACMEVRRRIGGDDDGGADQCPQAWFAGPARGQGRGWGWERSRGGLREQRGLGDLPVAHAQYRCVDRHVEIASHVRAPPALRVPTAPAEERGALQGQDDPARTVFPRI